MNKITKTALIVVCMLALVVAAFLLTRGCQMNRNDEIVPSELTAAPEETTGHTEPATEPSVPIEDTNATNPTDPSVTVPPATTQPTEPMPSEPSETVPSVPIQTDPVPVELESISVATVPAKCVYFVGDKLDLSGLVLMGHYSDGSYCLISDGISGYPMILDTLGRQSITINYGDRSVILEVEVLPVLVTDVKINSMPVKTEYDDGDKIDTTGLSLLISYNNGLKETLTSGFSVSPEILSGCGEHRITVKYNGFQTTFSVSVSHSMIASGSCGDSLTWEISECGVLTISGSGLMYDYTRGKGAPWSEYDIFRVILPDGLTNIGDVAFYWCYNITDIRMPDSLEEIGDYAFAACHRLSDLRIPNGVKRIGRNAFQSCFALTEISIPDSVTTIADSAFIEASNLSTIRIGKGLRYIGVDVFAYCNALSGVWVDEGNDWFINDERGALFSKDGTALVVFPRNITGKYVVPDGVVRLSDHAFQNSSVTEVIIPDSVKQIDKYAFEDSKLLSAVTIGSGIQEILFGAFEGCDALLEMRIYAMNCYIGSSNGLGDPGQTIIYAYYGSSIRFYAQSDCYEFVEL